STAVLTYPEGEELLTASEGERYSEEERKDLVRHLTGMSPPDMCSHSAEHNASDQDASRKCGPRNQDEGRCRHLDDADGDSEPIGIVPHAERGRPAAGG